MARGKVSKGKCSYCGVEFSKSGVSKHLSACKERMKVIEEADQKKSATEKLYHLRVQAEGASMFWLELEVRGSSTLDDLDHYLRRIWLECCGHMSRFSVGGWRGEEIDMGKKISQVFRPDVELTHIYDFGTSSVTLVKAVGTREGKPTTTHPIALMARNLMPEVTCDRCEKPAAWLCRECLEEGESGFLCATHAKQYPHDEYGEPLPLVNSPRMGVCGYDGPAEPPY